MMMMMMMMMLLLHFKKICALWLDLDIRQGLTISTFHDSIFDTSDQIQIQKVIRNQ